MRDRKSTRQFKESKPCPREARIDLLARALDAATRLRFPASPAEADAEGLFAVTSAAFLGRAGAA